jgi:Anti-sigma-K factor rskA, C-terminal
VTVAHIDPDLLALLALGEDAGEEASAHLAACPDCRAGVRQFAEVVTAARSGPDIAALEAPPPGLWARIAAETGADAVPVAGNGLAGRPGEDAGVLPAAGPAGTGSAAPGARPARDAPAGRPPWWRRRPLVSAVAALVTGLILGAGGALGIRQLTAGPATHVVASIPLRPLPQFPQWRAASGTAVMAEGPHGQQLTVSLRAPRKPGFYEVWLLARNGVSMISLGDLGPGHTGRFTMPPGVDLATYSRVDVSLQPFNGSTLHSRSSVVRGSLP